MTLGVLTLSHFIHVMGTVVWIGGILITLLVIVPSSKAIVESPSMVGKLMKEVARRFTPLANMSILLLIVTGIIMLYYDKNYTSFLDLKKSWNVVLAIKHFFVATMILIHFYRGLALNPKIEKSSSKLEEIRSAGLKKISLDLVKVNLALGIIVLLLTALSISM
ncbi:MAG: CopD family protein [Deltaproteobacteria bacterium]|nr:CopD family protein [Deltaproteobacteria bacterium]